MMRMEDAKKLLLRDYDPFLSLVRPHGEDTSGQDEEYRTLTKSYEDQKRSGAITSIQPRKTELQCLKKVQRLPHVITSTDIGSNSFKYRLSTFGKLAQKVNDPVIATWLESDFEKDDDSSVARGLMYNAYLEFCRVNKQCVSNQACFGKVVRNAFPYLQTRRIGGRGNSKYHYFGIRPKSGTATAEFFAEKDTRHRKSIRTLKKPLKLGNFCHESNRVEAHIKSESEDCDDFKMLIRILIPNFPSHDDINVPENILTEAHTMIDCMEKYAFDILRAIMQASEKPDFKEVFLATADFWSTISQAFEDDTILNNDNILELMSECDAQIQRTMRDILLPDLLAQISEEKTENLTILFGGIYLREMMAAVWPATEQVRQVKRKVYKKFSIDMIQRLNFIQLVNKVEESLEDKPIAQILHKAFIKIDINSLMSKCRFAFAMKKSDFITTEKTFRKGLTTFHASLNNGFHLRGCLIWVRSQVLDQIQLDKQHQDCRDRITVTLLCFSYAVSLLFAELVKHCPLPLQSGLRNLQVLLTDFISYAVKDELKSVK